MGFDTFFSFNLVLSGEATVLYDGKLLKIGRNDLFISVPGIRIVTQDVSDDYIELCLIIEEEVVVYGVPFARNVINASYSLANPASDNKLHLPDGDFRHLKARREEMRGYISGSGTYRNECLYSLYAFFPLTCLEYIDRFLMMEARYLLAGTDIPVSEIADRLHFANHSGSCKFFLRHQRVSPKEYRVRNMDL